MDFRSSVLDNYKIDGFVFCSNFDSGNLGKVELKKSIDTTLFGDITVHKEFDVWTTPDCFGTPRQSPNRTWFFFSIKGGKAYQNVRINVKNLNRQSKLFNQGMQPVMRIGNCGKWDRIKDKPLFQNDTDNFAISFIHRVMDKADADYYYAFTYPFTYTECQTMLEKFDHKYFKNAEDTYKSIKTLNAYPKSKADGTASNFKSPNYQSLESNTSLLCSSSTNKNSNVSKIDLLNEIYYQRELLINSLEGRRVDLITITSFHGITDQIEGSLENLFPEQKRRPHIFQNKKIIFLSSRVHPGETPASFVLNGFLNMLLDDKNPVARSLRQLYVFKIVPILNPDGVYRGFYRTDTLGQNLNRMYTNTLLEAHPTIYAVKKIIYYYSFGIDNEETSKMDTTVSEISENISASAASSEEDKLIDEKYTSNKIELINQNNADTLSNDTEINTDEKGTTDDSENNNRINENKPIKKPKKSVMVASTFKSDSKQRIFLRPRTIVKKNVIKKEENNPSSSSSTSSYKKNKIMQPNINISSEFLQQFNVTPNLEIYKIFLYIDFHGHASKKGIFMYGNHFSNNLEAVECKLLPKLMSINSQHFHYDACNFSEKNMYKREKRDGLSKEGSGRVAVYKMTGIIKCYTLESNYNTGRYVNVIPSAGNNCKKKIQIPTSLPKYTPSVYEEIGRALGPSILDMTNSNNYSRLPNTDYRSLQGLKMSLKSDIERNNPQNRVLYGNKSSLSSHHTLKRFKKSPMQTPVGSTEPITGKQSKENITHLTALREIPSSALKASIKEQVSIVSSTKQPTRLIRQPNRITYKMKGVANNVKQDTFTNILEQNVLAESSNSDLQTEIYKSIKKNEDAQIKFIKSNLILLPDNLCHSSSNCLSVNTDSKSGGDKHSNLQRPQTKNCNKNRCSLSKITSKVSTAHRLTNNRIQTNSVDVEDCTNEESAVISRVQITRQSTELPKLVKKKRSARHEFITIKRKIKIRNSRQH